MPSCLDDPVSVSDLLGCPEKGQRCVGDYSCRCWGKGEEFVKYSGCGMSSVVSSLYHRIWASPPMFRYSISRGPQSAAKRQPRSQRIFQCSCKQGIEILASVFQASSMTRNLPVWRHGFIATTHPHAVATSLELPTPAYLAVVIESRLVRPASIVPPVNAPGPPRRSSM